MPQNNTPDVTSPVPALNRSRFIGVTGNMDNGTAKGPLTAGNTNNSIGGIVFVAAGTTTNTFPNNQADLLKTQDGGASFQNTTSSSNPAFSQEQVADRIETEAVIQSTPALVNSAAAGDITVFPKTTETIELVNTSSVSSNLEVKREEAENAYVGITTNKTFVVDELTRLAEMKQDVEDNGTDNKIDGAAKIGDPDALYTESQRNSLPGGHQSIVEVGNE